MAPSAIATENTWWKYFTRSDDQTLAKCLACGETIACGKGKTKTTTSAARHLLKYHPERYAEKIAADERIRDKLDAYRRDNHQSARKPKTPKSVRHLPRSSAALASQLNRLGTTEVAAVPNEEFTTALCAALSRVSASRKGLDEKSKPTLSRLDAVVQNLKRKVSGVSSSTSHTAQRSPSRASGSSSTNNEPNQNGATNGAEIPAMTAYRIRQTYIFMRVLSTQRAVFCKANDEDFFPPHRTNSTAADRANWSAGQIITAYFDFDQKKTECVVEAVGDRETVQLRLQEALITDALKRPNGRGGTQTPQMNGAVRRAPSPNSALRELLIPKLENGGVDEEERLSMDGGSADSALLDDDTEPLPAKRPRLDSANGFLSSDAIATRFEQLERRIRALESRRPLHPAVGPLVPLPTMNGHNGADALNAQFDVEVDGERISLKDIPTDTLTQQIETNKMALMEKPLVLNGRRLYDDFHHINLARVLQHGSAKEFGARVLALLVSDEVRRHCYVPPISSAIAANGSANVAVGRELKKVVVDAFKKLLIFAGGSAICPADQPAWFAAIYAALPQNSADPNATPERFDDNPDALNDSPTEPVFGVETAFVETSRAASTVSSS